MKIKLKKNLIPLFWVVAIIVSSCVRSKEDIPTESKLNLEEVQATIPHTDLTLRQGWNLIVGDRDYTYSLSTNSINGIPEKDPYVMDQINNSIQINFYRRDFPADDRNDISDQSTKQKIVRADGLEAIYTGAGSKKISVDLKHRLMLLDFEVLGTQKELQMSIIGGLVIKPYKVSPNRFQVIYFETGGLGVHLFIGGKRYDALINTDPFTADQHKRFTIQYNSQSDAIAISNGAETTWSSEIWPE